MKKLFTQLVVLVGLSFLSVTGCRKDDQPSPPNPPPGNSANQPPKAYAGGTRTVLLPINSVDLNGTGADKDGQIASYLWARISGPGQYTLLNASAANARATNLVEGVYGFELTVTDNGGLTAKDTTIVTVSATCPCVHCDDLGDPCDPWDY